MNKILKIGGVGLGMLVILFALAIVLSGSMSSPSINKSFQMSGISGGSPGQSTEFSSPMVSDSSMNRELIPEPDSVSYKSEVAQDLPQTDKKVIKNGDLSLKVDSADKAMEKISEIAKGNGGELFSSNLYEGANSLKSGLVVVKIPSANFEKTFAEIKKVASLVIQESTSGQDVTDQYVDLKAQLTNRQAEEQSFMRILDQAQKIDDVLAVTRELARVRGNIEQLQGKIKYLESQTDMATISVNLTEDSNITVVDSWRPLQVVKDGINSLVRGLQGLVDFIILFIIVVAPFLILWGIIIWIVYRLGRKIYLKLKDRV